MIQEHETLFHAVPKLLKDKVETLMLNLISEYSTPSMVDLDVRVGVCFAFASAQHRRRRQHEHWHRHWHRHRCQHLCSRTVSSVN